MQVKERNLEESNKLWEKAVKLIMDGTQLYSRSPYVYVKGVYPIYVKGGKGSHVFDVDGNEYIDVVMGLGPVILGYCYPRVDEAVKEQMKSGMVFSQLHPLELKCAELLIKHIPSAEMVRFLKSGAEATSAAVRLARAYTKRDKIIRGEYHGWHDWCMANTEKNTGIPRSLHDTVFYPGYNNLEKFKVIFEENPGQIAAIITEAMELEEPKDNFLHNIKKLAHDNGSLLIFDETVTGLRFGLGGAQKYFGVTPDISTFGKAIANGMPLSAAVARAEIMESVKDSIFISTTFGSETLSLAASVATIKEMEDKDVAKRLWHNGEFFQKHINKILEENNMSNMKLVGIPYRLNIDFKDDNGKFWPELKTLFMQECVKRGVIFGWNILTSFSHTDEDLNHVAEAVSDAVGVCKRAIDDDKQIKKYLEGDVITTVL